MLQRIVIPALLAALILPATAATPARKESSLVWPPAPDQPRIRFVGTFYSAKDFHANKGLSLKRALEKMLGTEEREPPMMFPYGVATDSRGRVIVADSKLQAVHVFDAANHSSLLIRTLKGDRMLSPIGVATDAADNIYVSDSLAGKIFEFDPRGKVKLVIGHPEARYKRPTGIAIDRAAQRLYIADTLKTRLW